MMKEKINSINPAIAAGNIFRLNDFTSFFGRLFSPKNLVLSFLFFGLIFGIIFRADADLRTPSPPGWWDPDGVASGQDWHYRVPVTLPATSSVNSTAKVNVDFAVLMAQLSISGSFDINSVRVVRPNGTIAAVQEYTDTIFNNATDAASNNRGEVKWIVQDGGAQTYYIYFDITQNGTKSANAQPVINGNFEFSATGQEDPTNWSGTKTNANFDAQVRPNETVSVTTDGANQTRSTNGNANSGNFSYLLGARTNNEPAAGAPATTLSRTITVPATNPGNITIRWKPQGWDGSVNGATTQWDWIRAEIVNGATTNELIGPTAGNYVTNPFSPNMGTGAVSASAPGYGQYNGWDTTSTGTHTAGMTIAQGSENWFTANFSLAAYAGQTITIQFRTFNATLYKSWYLIDDIEWSIVNGTLGTAEAFGTVITAPIAGASFYPGTNMTITAQVDANPSAATNPMTANVYDNSGALVASNIRLYNDGTHGDVTANDAIWTNNGSDSGNPTYTIPVVSPSSNWTVRVFAKDASTSTNGAANNGLAKRNSLPTAQIEANYWNIDEILFNVIAANFNVTKINNVLSDPVSASNPKAIPGAVVRYCITMTNGGAAPLTNLSATDTMPTNVTYVAGSMRSGASCGAASTVEDDNNTGTDESDPYGASISGNVITAVAPTLAASTSFVLTYTVTVN
ncbi:hypothetical protein LPB140_05035 [Sphingorhabdus lutea]|uniref:Uncharacterized protein n=1 Tax=Sphingorhabdus lutea TaxID=1913578 RepID=A0A1L3JAX3_9SPHN|nr:DUF11 domain-containing protein [Sphingorhabdus lutea]APG62271.1 hypothetical protein LPB140_05035 [Sphingorhabdus lutea]